jgi:hypothetical protein
MQRWFELESRRRMLWLPWIMVLGRTAAGLCGSIPSFTEFRQINEENFRAIQSGTIRMQYTQFNRVRREDLETEAQNMRSALEGYAAQIQKRDLPEAQKKSLIETMERNLVGRAQKKLEANQLESQSKSVRAYTFDLGTTKYRLDEKVTESTGSVPAHDRVIVTSAGMQVRYHPQVDEAVVDYFKSPVAKDLPAYLGVAPPANLGEIADDAVVARTVTLDGRELVVYEATRAGTSDGLRIYVDPQIGYRYRRIEFLKEGRILRTIVADRYEFFGGIPFPRFHEEKYLDADDKETARRATTMEVESAQFNQAIDPNVFRIQYTAHTLITDTKMGIRYQASPDLGTAELATVEDLAERGLEEKMRLDLLAQSRSGAGQALEANAPARPDTQENRASGGPAQSPVPGQAIGSGRPVFRILSLLTIVVLVLAVGGLLLRRGGRQENR